MSIFLAATGSNITTTAPTTQPLLSTWITLAILGWLLLAILAAKLLGAFRPRSIVGPARLAAEESVWTLVFAFFGGACMAIFLVSILNRFLSPAARTNIVLQNALLEGAAFLNIVGLMKMFRPQGIQLLGLRPIQIPRGIALGAATLFIVFPMVFAVGALIEMLFIWAGRAIPIQDVLQVLGETHTTPALIIMIGFAVVGVPLAEELAFRGFLQTVLANGINWLLHRPEKSDVAANSPGARSRWIAVVITAALFAAVHGEVAIFPQLFVLALGLGYVYERTGNLWATIATHSLFNGIQIILFLGISSH